MSENNRNKKYANIKIEDDLKKWFINDGENISEETYKSYENLMKKVTHYEHYFRDDKNLYNFSRDEILDMYTMFGSSSSVTLNVYNSIVKKYIDLAIEQGYIKTNINPAYGISLEDLEEITNRTKAESKFIEREDIYNLAQSILVNYQDQAILLLLFEGLTIDEIRELKEEQINWNERTIELKREDKIIIREINPTLINILKLMKNIDEYQLRNGRKSKKGGGSKNKENEEKTIKYNIFMSKEDTEYFIRPIQNRSHNKKKIDDKIALAGIQNRIYKILDDFLGLKYISISDVYKCGLVERMCDYALTLDKNLTIPMLQEYCNNFKEKASVYPIFKQVKEMLEAD